MGAQVYLVKYYNYGANTIAVLISEKRLDSLLNYNDMSIKEAAFYLTDKKGKILCGSGEDWTYGEAIENLQKQDPSISIYRGSVLEDAYQMYYSVKSSEYAAYSTSGIVIFGFLVLSLLFFGTIVWYMQKEIFQPIADLSWVSRKIHSGDFRARAEYNTNSYEMEEVKQAYNDMVQTILEMRVAKVRTGTSNEGCTTEVYPYAIKTTLFPECFINNQQHGLSARGRECPYLYSGIFTEHPLYVSNWSAYRSAAG